MRINVHCSNAFSNAACLSTAALRRAAYYLAVKAPQAYRNKRVLSRYLHNYDTEPWGAKLFESQAEIAAHLDKAQGYTKRDLLAFLSTYRSRELLYWMHIPRWIYEDYNNRDSVRCLDIGCAWGALALFTAKVCNADVYCIDKYNRWLSEVLKKKYNLNFCVNSIETDPVPQDIRFDLIILTEVLEHFWFHPLPTLKKIKSLLNTSGRLYLSTPDAAQWGCLENYTTFSDMPPPNTIDQRDLKDCAKNFGIDHVYHFDKNELLQVVHAAGFDVARCAYSPGFIHRHLNLTLTPGQHYAGVGNGTR